MTLRVSDHALVRFLDRAGGLPIEELRAALAASLERASAAAAAVGSREYTIVADGLLYRVIDGHVVTVLVHHRGRRP